MDGLRRLAAVLAPLAGLVFATSRDKNIVLDAGERYLARPRR
jgi:hypothetical protein